MLVAALWRCTWGRGREGAMAPASLSSGFQSFTPLPTIKLGPSGAGSRVGGPVHTLGPCGSLQQPLLWGWESLLLPPQPPRAFSIRGLRLYFPELEPWVVRSASLPASSQPFVQFICAQIWGCRVLPTALPALFSATLSPALWVYLCKCGAAGSASAGTTCAIRPTLRQSQCHHSHASPLLPGARLCPSYQPGWMFIFYFLGVGPPCCSILCQFWLCEEAQCVYLRHHLGSPPSYNILLQLFVYNSITYKKLSVSWQHGTNLSHLCASSTWISTIQCELSQYFYI